jgi:hypothetical protein
MSGLLQPWWLIAMGVIPWIHWLHRKQAPLSVHSVSAVFLWQDGPTEAAPGRQQQPPDPAWRRRALITALVIAALTTPYIEREHATVTIWLDDSLSMQTVENGETRLTTGERLLDAALGDSDYEQVVRNSLSDGFPSRLEPSSAHWLVTDGASKRIREWADRIPIDHVIHVGEATENVAVTRLAARRSIDDPSLIDVLVSVSNTGGGPAERRLELHRGIQVAATMNVSLAPGETFHWQTQTADVPGGLSATLSAGDALVDDDVLDIPADALRQQVATVDRDCGAALRTAINTHPALMVSADSPNPDLEVSCAPAFGDASATVPTIRAQTKDLIPMTSAAVWLPQESPVLLQAAGKPLITRTGQTVDTVIDLRDSDFARQPGYAVIVAALVDAALGRDVLDNVTAETRVLDEVIIQPGRITVITEDAPDTLRAEIRSLSLYLLIAALFVLVLDIVLLIRSRRRAAHV